VKVLKKKGVAGCRGKKARAVITTGAGFLRLGARWTSVSKVITSLRREGKSEGRRGKEKSVGRREGLQNTGTNKGWGKNQKNGGGLRKEAGGEEEILIFENLLTVTWLVRDLISAANKDGGHEKKKKERLEMM